MKVARSDQHVASSNIFEYFCTVLLSLPHGPWMSNMRVFHGFSKKDFSIRQFSTCLHRFSNGKKAHPLQQKNRFCCSRYEGGSNKN